MPLKITCWQPGDTLVPFGKKRPVRLKKIFADAEIGSYERSAYPVIRGADGSVLWVALLRNSNLDPVTEQTRRVLRLSVIQKHLQHQC
jgi:tRNA(Ile)-lysidine synthase